MKYLMRYDNDDSLSVSNFSIDHPIVARYDDDGSVGYRRFKKVDYITMGTNSSQSYFLIPYLVNSNTTISQTVKFSNTTTKQQRTWCVKHRLNMYCEVYLNANTYIAYGLANEAGSNNANIWKSLGNQNPGTDKIWEIQWVNSSYIRLYNLTNYFSYSAVNAKWLISPPSSYTKTSSTNVSITNTAGDYLIIGGSLSNDLDYNANPFIGKLYRTKISEGSNIIYDLRPIKYLGQGALYDVISKQIFVNQSSDAYAKPIGYGYYADDLNLERTNDEATLHAYYDGWLFCDF